MDARLSFQNDFFVPYILPSAPRSVIPGKKAGGYQVVGPRGAMR
jgi:hypothetical protein